MRPSTERRPPWSAGAHDRTSYTMTVASPLPCLSADAESDDDVTVAMAAPPVNVHRNSARERTAEGDSSSLFAGTRPASSKASGVRSAQSPHPNVVHGLVAGQTVAELIGAVHPRKLPPRFVAAALAGALRGLHAIHESPGGEGVHRRISPHTIHLGADGVGRVLDPELAKAKAEARTAYMAPEQLLRASVDRRADVHAAGIVLWEALSAAPLFHADSDAATAERVLSGCITPPSTCAGTIPLALEAVVMRALARDPEGRFTTALEMAVALDDAFDGPTPTHEVAAWLAAVAGDRVRDQWNARARSLGDPAASVPVPRHAQRSPMLTRGGTKVMTAATSSIPRSSPMSNRAWPSPLPGARDAPGARARPFVKALAVVVALALTIGLALGVSALM